MTAALITKARKWRKSALPATPWGDNHIVNELADALEVAEREIAEADRSADEDVAQIAYLREQLVAAQSTISKALNAFDSFNPYITRDILAGANFDALAAHESAQH